jgi:hypothetical protein
MAETAIKKPLPQIAAEAKPFWDAALSGLPCLGMDAPPRLL